VHKKSPLLIAINSEYFSKFLSWRQVNYQPVGELYKIQGFEQYNHLVDINSFFSSWPSGDIIDRTRSVDLPGNFWVSRPWVIPEKCSTLDQVMHDRVNFYVLQNQKLNLFWSGGIDSTAMVSAFLQHCTDVTQLRLIYTPFSLYENPDFFNFLEKHYPYLEKLDISGDVYLDTHFDGIMINGHGGDEYTASLDESFVEKLTGQEIFNPWKDYFVKQNASHDLIEFFEQYCSLSGRSINTVLEARWWYYAAAKSQIYVARDRSFVSNQSNAQSDHTSAFYDCLEFEGFMWHNIDKILTKSSDYSTYKKFLKEYTHHFFKNDDYFNTQKKVNSQQVNLYTRKKTELLDLRWLFKLSDGTEVRTKNLPLLSKKEFDQAHSSSLDYLFNF